MPPYLAGRIKEKEEFERIIEQKVVLDNFILTGLRGVGKTVLLDTLKPIALSKNWLWVGTDLSESISLSEERIALRMMTDLSVVTSSLVIDKTVLQTMIGFGAKQVAHELKLDFDTMVDIYDRTPGLVIDKIKSVLEIVWKTMSDHKLKGIVFAYDEAQNLADHSAKEEYPLSLMLDLFQSLQKKGAPFILVLTGLPTLFPKLVEARTYAERMFRVCFLDRLTDDESRDAVVKPVSVAECPITMTDDSVELCVEKSAGYPYFIQFLCREIYDIFLQNIGERNISIPIIDILRKLDTDFFAGRWGRATDRERDLLRVVANLENCDHEFTVQEVVQKSKQLLEHPMSASQISQMFGKLAKSGLIYKNRHGKYSFAVPLMAQFILRQRD